MTATAAEHVRPRDIDIDIDLDLAPRRTRAAELEPVSARCAVASIRTAVRGTLAQGDEDATFAGTGAGTTGAEVIALGTVIGIVGATAAGKTTKPTDAT